MITPLFLAPFVLFGKTAAPLNLSTFWLEYFVVPPIDLRGGLIVFARSFVYLRQSTQQRVHSFALVRSQLFSHSYEHNAWCIWRSLP